MRVNCWAQPPVLSPQCKGIYVVLVWPRPGRGLGSEPGRAGRKALGSQSRPSFCCSGFLRNFTSFWKPSLPAGKTNAIFSLTGVWDDGSFEFWIAGHTGDLSAAQKHPAEPVSFPVPLQKGHFADKQPLFHRCCNPCGNLRAGKNLRSNHPLPCYHGNICW